MEALTVLRGAFRENPGYLHLLSEPSLALSERQGLIDEMLGEGANKYLGNFLKLLCERQLLNEFYGCCDEFARRYREDRNIAEAVAYSAIPLTREQEDALRARLEKLSGKTVWLRVQEDRQVIGGLRVVMEGTELDGSLKGRLTGISRKLSEDA